MILFCLFLQWRLHLVKLIKMLTGNYKAQILIHVLAQPQLWKFSFLSSSSQDCGENKRRELYIKRPGLVKEKWDVNFTCMHAWMNDFLMGFRGYFQSVTTRGCLQNIAKKSSNSKLLIISLKRKVQGKKKANSHVKEIMLPKRSITSSNLQPGG